MRDGSDRTLATVQSFDFFFLKRSEKFLKKSKLKNDMMSSFQTIRKANLYCGAWAKLPTFHIVLPILLIRKLESRELIGPKVSTTRKWRKKSHDPI